MLARTLYLRLALVAVAGTAAGVFPIIAGLGPRAAYADDDDDDDGGDDDGGDDDDGGGGDDEDDEEEDDEDQPPITAGGLYMLKTYPISELQRPLTMTEGISEVKLGVGFDISNKTAFKSAGASLDFRYGYKDNVEFQAGVKGIYNFKGFSLNAGMEAGIVYDLVDFRANLVVNRPASSADGDPGDTGFALDVGFPFRYAPKEQVGVVAFDSLFQFDLVADDLSVDDNGMLKKDARPDFKPSVGIVVQPVPMFAIKVEASIQIPNFDFSTKDSVAIPVTASFQYTASNKFDAGMEFTFPNLKPPPVSDGMGGTVTPNFYDTRFLLFYGQLRFGR